MANPRQEQDSCVRAVLEEGGVFFFFCAKIQQNEWRLFAKKNIKHVEGGEINHYFDKGFRLKVIG